MTISDFILLGKKIAVGIIVALIPVVILLSGVWVTQKALKSDKQNKATILNHKN